MYDKFFNDPAIDKGMQSDEFTEETFEAYMFRLINLHSKFSKLNALKGLPEISKAIKLNEISRLRTTEDALKVALEVYGIIIDAIEPLAQPQNGNGQGQGQGNGEAGEGEQEAGEDDIDVQMSDDEGDGDDSGDTDGNADMSGDSNEPAEDGKGMTGKISVKVGKNGKPSDKPADGRLSQRQALWALQPRWAPSRTSCVVCRLLVSTWAVDRYINANPIEGPAAGHVRCGSRQEHVGHPQEGWQRVC